MEMALTREKLWPTVINVPEEDPGVLGTTIARKKYEDWVEKDNDARAMICLHVDEDQYIHVRNKTTAKQCWTALKEFYEKDSLVDEVSMMKRMYLKKLVEGGNMVRHIAEFNELFQKLNDMGPEKLPERWHVTILLCSLPRSYDAMVSALQVRNSADRTMAFVQSTLLDEYNRRIEDSDEVKGESVLKAMDSKTCFFCKKAGHVKAECHKYKKWKQKKDDSYKSGDKANVAEETRKSEKKEFLFTCSNVAHDGWIIDSGATSHLTGIKKNFTSIDESFRSFVDMADGNKVNVLGKGVCAIDCLNSSGLKTTVQITDVLYAPQVNGSLLSVSKLAHKGYTVKFDDHLCEFKRGNEQIAVLDKLHNLYKLRQPEVVCAIKSTDHERCIHQWHRIFGHRDPIAIREMFKNNLIVGAKLVECSCQSMCEVCLKAKSTCLPFPKESMNRSKKALELIHTDVCGPMQTMSRSGKRYLLTLIDDYSKFTVISFLSHKSEVEVRMKEYIDLVNNRFGYKPNIIRSDRGGEYLGNQFKEYLRKQGIEQQLTAPRTPQQNGTAERKNRTLIEMARCLLTDAQLPHSFWAEAVNAANYIQNRVLTRSTNKSPYELWYERRPDTRHMRIIGSKCFVHVPKEDRRKLDNTATKMILIGYDEQSKAYRCYDMVNKKVTISRNVRFINEEVHQETAEIEFGNKRRKKAKKPISEDNSDTDNIETDSDTYAVRSEISDSDDTISPVDESNVSNIDDLPMDSDETPADYANVPRRSHRTNKGVPPVRYGDNIYAVIEPKTLAQALSSDQKDQWVEAMNSEMDSLKQNDTWSLCELPSNRSPVGSKWVYKAKTDATGKISRYKARLVAQGFSQKYGVDYDQVFAPVVRQTTFRLLLSKASKENLCVRHLDAKTAFLNGKLKETIFMKQPPGYVDEKKPHFVCHLKKSLYGLKQAARSWNEEINRILLDIDFQQSMADACLYTKHDNDGWVYLLIYVDDIIIAAKSKEVIDQIKTSIQKQIDIQDLGYINHYLGMEVTKDTDGIYYLCQSTYINQVVREFGLGDSKVSPIPIGVSYGKAIHSNDNGLLLSNAKYQQLTGCLLYISVNTRPDIAAAVAILAQKTSKPHQDDWNELKRVLRYLKGTANYKLALASKSNNDISDLFGYADANWAEDRLDRKSNSGYVFMFNGGVVSWMCRKQGCVALSSTEAEFIALSEACQEAIWLRKVLTDLNFKIDSPTLIFEDNQSCLKLIVGEKLSKRTKHVDTKKHFVRDHVDGGDIRCEYCSTDDMIADLFTKPLAEARFKKLREMCGVCD